MKSLHRRLDALEAHSGGDADLSAWTDEQLIARLVEIHAELEAAGYPLPDGWRELVANGEDWRLNRIVRDWGQQTCGA